jgi:hypothetical protein
VQTEDRKKKKQRGVAQCHKATKARQNRGKSGS